MSRQTMSFALPESTRGYIDNRVAAGSDGNARESARRRCAETTSARRAWMRRKSIAAFRVSRNVAGNGESFPAIGFLAI